MLYKQSVNITDIIANENTVQREPREGVEHVSPGWEQQARMGLTGSTHWIQMCTIRRERWK